MDNEERKTRRKSNWVLWILFEVVEFIVDCIFDIDSRRY